MAAAAAAAAAAPSGAATAAVACGGGGPSLVPLSRAAVRRRGQLVLEGLSTPEVAARARVDAVAVLGAHLALSLVVDGPDASEPGLTVLLGFAAEAGAAASDGNGVQSEESPHHRRRRPGQRATGAAAAATGPLSVASPEAQRRFLADLARGRPARLPGLSLGDPTRAPTLGLHFFPSAKQSADQGSAGGEPRLLALQADGLVRLWALRGRLQPAWVPLTSFLLPFRHRPLPGSFSFDGISRRLVYVEAVEDGEGEEEGGEEAPLRVVSREIVFTPLGGGHSGGGGGRGRNDGAEAVTVGCAVPLAHAAGGSRELEAVHVGSRGCWVVTAARVGYNCFASKRLVWMARRERPGQGQGHQQGAGPVFFALHAVTEQLLALDLGAGGQNEGEGGALSVFTPPGLGTPLRRRVLCRGLLQRITLPDGAPVKADEVGGFAVHRNLALLALPRRGRLAVFHLRTGDFWCDAPLSPLSEQLAPSDGGDRKGAPMPPPSPQSVPWFWVDRCGSTAAGVWWPEHGNLLLRFAYPTASEEQAFLSSRGPSGLAAARQLCREHGPSLAFALSHRALDAADAAVHLPETPPAQAGAATRGAADAAAAAREGEGGEEQEDDGEGSLAAAAAAAAAGAEATTGAETGADAIPLALQLGLWIAGSTGDRHDEDEQDGSEGSESDPRAQQLERELRAALREAEGLRSASKRLAEAPVSRTEKSSRCEALAALASRLRRGEKGRFRRVTPLLLAAEPLLRQWLEQRGEGRPVIDRGGGSSSGSSSASSAPGRTRAEGEARRAAAPGAEPILSAIDLAHAACRARGDRMALASAWARVLAADSGLGADEKPGEEEEEEQGQEQEQEQMVGAGYVGGVGGERDLARLRPLLLYCCALGEDGFLEALAPLLFRLRPARLVHLVARLAEPDAQPLPPQHPHDAEGAAEAAPSCHDFYYRARFLLPPSPSSAIVQGVESARAPPAGQGSAAADDGAQSEARRAVYARALRLLDPPARRGGGEEEGDEDEDEDEEREAAYRALLEGAGRFVCLARRLVLGPRPALVAGAQHEGWTAALALLDRLRSGPTSSTTRAQHEVFAFLLGRALGGADPGRVEAVVARRPPALTVADVWHMARRVQQGEDGEAPDAAAERGEGGKGCGPRLCMASFKHCLSLLLQAQAASETGLGAASN